MNLQQLYYFQKIAECQQYTLAAQELHVTQAALSYAISNLERELGGKFFERTGKKVLLTECGKASLACVQEALQALDRGERMVRELALPSKTVIKLSYLESLKHLVLGLISEQCAQEQEPAFHFELAHSNSASIEQQLLRREIDLGISTAPAKDGIASHLIGYQDNVVIIPRKHPWARRGSIPLSALEGQRLIAYSRECVIRGYYDSILKTARVHPEVFAESRFHGSILDMVSYHMGVAIVPRMKRLEERHDLLSLSIEDDIPPRAVYLLWAEGAVQMPAVEAFRRYIVESKDPGRYL